MSAAEKLKALEATIPGDYSNWAAKSSAYETAPYGTHDALAALRNALPQIVAVVVLAEHYGYADDIHAYGKNPGEPALPDLVAALAALDEALSPPTGGSP